MFQEFQERVLDRVSYSNHLSDIITFSEFDYIR